PLARWETDAPRPSPQHQAAATDAPNPTRETARIRWDDPAERVARLIRGLDPKPGAWTTLPGDGKRETGNGELKLFGVRVEEGHGAPGEVLTADGRLLIATGSGGVEVAGVAPGGKVRMAGADVVRGRGVQAGQRFA